MCVECARDVVFYALNKDDEEKKKKNKRTSSSVQSVSDDA